MAQLKIPYESLDPLTIGASGDEEQGLPRGARARDPRREPARRDLPRRAEPVGDATEAARAALESPVSGPRFSELLAGATKVAV